MRLRRKYDIDIIGMSNSQNIINHIEEYLLKERFTILDKGDTGIIYRYKYFGFSDWSFASRVREGQIEIKLINNKLQIELTYNNLELIVFSLFLLCILCLLLFKSRFDFSNDMLDFISFGILWIFGGNFLIRYFANRKLMNNINLLVKKLST
jgi:hypothetical protein